MNLTQITEQARAGHLDDSQCLRLIVELLLVIASK